MGYDSSRTEKSYKILGTEHPYSRQGLAIFEFATNTWKLIDRARSHLLQPESIGFNSVSLNGNLYWTAYNLETGQCFIRFLDFSKEVINPLCSLPREDTGISHIHVLAIFKGDRFSLLEQCHSTMNIEIWVTKKKISNGDPVKWIKFMTVSKPNIPMFGHMWSSYLVDTNMYGKSFVMCSIDKETKQACVYVVRENMYKKIKIGDVFCKLGCSVYVPSLIPITVD